MALGREGSDVQGLQAMKLGRFELPVLLGALQGGLRRPRRLNRRFPGIRDLLRWAIRRMRRDSDGTWGVAVFFRSVDKQRQG